MATLHDPKLTIIDVLPPELLGDVFSWFCSHCSGCGVENEDNAADIKSLVALTQTNRIFRSIAMPVLFHSLGPCLPSTYFFRVLDCQPDLARMVKHLCLPLSTPKSSSVIKDSEFLARLADNISLDLGTMKRKRFCVIDSEMCLAMALCSGMERLRIHISGDQIIGQTRHFELLNILLGKRKHEIFPNLRHLDINKTQCNKFSLCDPEQIILMRGAPRLEKLILRGPEGERESDQNSDLGIQEFCSSVKNIIEFQLLGLPFFTGSWQTLALERILGAAQNLQRFKFVTDDYGCWNNRALSQISPTQLIEFLSPRTQITLQRLSLNFDSRMEPGLRNLPKPKPITPQQIKQFTNLTTLEVDSSCYYSHVLQRNKDEVIVEQETYLVDFLPQTVQSLTIFFNRWARYEVLHDVTYLGQRAIAGDFPKLKRVRIDAPIHYTMPGSNSWDDQWDNEQLAKLSTEMNVRRDGFQEAFVGSGVETQFKTWYIWEEG
ncbi:uncharacterized protein BKA55DRAFT_583036 [Fusarium redolens]|uniref:Uncharacterized protein n=1 Tax=Fusarium redolens TaxID=48865 RepID=A0A9P9G119_FUSRE|nr:uncharacterized protein BKA55DRAFT_583036 [Fusarium redolens]KAH7230551.1 hypothetical protein BKA55DRAFT_583036 [Fusarium redolens]